MRFRVSELVLTTLIAFSFLHHQAFSQLLLHPPADQDAGLALGGPELTYCPSHLVAPCGSRSEAAGSPSPRRARQTSGNLTTLVERRLPSIIGTLKSPANISSWLYSLDSSGKWPDSEIDYTTGCAARRANWPASDHWQRILILSGAWHGGYAGAEEWARSERVRSAIRSAMAYWFQRDMKTVDCMDWGGTPKCPCENPDNTLNTNWYSNIILVPSLAGKSCLLLTGALSTYELEACSAITRRAYGTFDINLNGVGYFTGANTLDVARVGVDCGLLHLNVSMVSDAYRRIHAEMVILNTTKADGIRLDGSFGQHSGMLYNGNYGKDYSNAVLDLEVVSAGTEYAANSLARVAYDTLFDGHKWMIYANSLTQVLHFDFSAIGRMITFPIIDDQASGSIQMNLTKVKELGHLWSSPTLVNFGESLLENSTNANAGKLYGNRLFYANDYMVHRDRGHVSTLKMYSSRTLNTECVNTQNPSGFHLSDGTLYTYLRGDEYEDISAAWDWNLIPGTTTDYGNTPLTCARARVTGVESFVGGLSDGRSGISAMRYTNPTTKAIRWQKTWFFLSSGAQHVMVNILAFNGTAPVYSVLDQKRQIGKTIANGRDLGTGVYALPGRLWHANVGYTFPETATNASLHLRIGPRSGNWSSIGTSLQPPITVDLWAGWIHHVNWSQPFEYTAHPGTSYANFLAKTDKSMRSSVQTIANNRDVSAIYDRETELAMVVFWTEAGGRNVTVAPAPGDAPVTITASANCIAMFSWRTGTVSVADPTQKLSQLKLSFSLGQGLKPPFWQGGRSKTLTFRLPSGGQSGDRASQNIQ